MRYPSETCPARQQSSSTVLAPVLSLRHTLARRRSRSGRLLRFSLALCLLRCFRARRIRMSQSLARFDMIPHSLLQNFRFWESLLSLAIPDQDLTGAFVRARLFSRHVRQMDLKDASCRGDQSYLPNTRAEGRQELLLQPGCAEQPFALRAECDCYTRQRYGSCEDCCCCHCSRSVNGM